MDCQSPTPTSQNSPLLVNTSAHKEPWISIFQASDELVCSKKSEFAVLVLGFEKLGLEFDNRGRNFTFVGGQLEMPIVILSHDSHL
jgi:hypothetical protein